MSAASHDVQGGTDLHSILVSHPHAAAVASAAAAALARSAQLACYVTGVAAAEGSSSSRLLRAGARANGVLLNRVIMGVGAGELRSLAMTEMVARAVSRIAPAAWLGGRSTYDIMFAMHDAAVARMRWPSSTSAVYAYEDASFRTFQRAMRTGRVRIWDLPTPHWASAERIWTEETRRWPVGMGPRATVEPAWKKAQKDRELEMADVIVVASRFTRTSLEHFTEKKRIVEVPYGFPHDRFRPQTRSNAEPFTVLCVGSLDLRKGTQYLLEAWRKAKLRDARLRLIGRMRLSSEFLSQYAGTFEHISHVPREALATEYANADLLAFPTLGDGFGLVILESMSCGTPVLTTRCGGGPECIADGVEGWIVPERDTDALVEKLRFAAANRDRLGEMGVAARLRASKYGWAEAGERLVRELDRALN